MFLAQHIPSGLVNASNVTFHNDVSGILGLGFPRLSRIFSSLTNGEHPRARNRRCRPLISAHRHRNAVFRDDGSARSIGLPALRAEPHLELVGQSNPW